MAKFDYIILGAGASGLLLAYRMANDAFFDKKAILIVDKLKDKGNDRTWCYWEEGDGEWDDIIYKSWKKIYFGSDWLSETIAINPYSYKMIRSEGFYNKLWTVINKTSNITFCQAEVSSIESSENSVLIKTITETFEAEKVFNSLLFNEDYKIQKKFPVLKQHFIGWFIKTKTPHFDASVATFMDFKIPQIKNTRFMYVLPTSDTEALFEYTLFSEQLLKKEEYEAAIETYLKAKNIVDYTIVEKEIGAIPMTSYRFSKDNSQHVLNIGTAGGWTKASTGYTFKNTTKKTKALVEFLKSESDLSKFAKRTKFWYYDLLMLDVLANDNSFGAKMFSKLFQNSKVTTIFDFLDEESNLLQDLKVITSVPPLKFIKALVKRLI